MPVGITIQWRAEASKFNGPWHSHAEGGNGLDASSGFCAMTVTGVPSGGRVDIRSGPQNLTNGQTVPMPVGITIQWRAEASNFNGPWHNHAVDCNGLNASSGFCSMTVTGVPPGGKVDIRSGPQNLTNGQSVPMPVGITIQWRGDGAGASGQWFTHYVDCNGLDASGAFPT
jgi:hypothetical protein